MVPRKPVLIIKIGTNALLGKHEMPRTVFDLVAADITELAESYRVVLVTSGAIGFGVRALKLEERPQEIDRLQALAMIGQTGLLRRWREAFGDTMIGQVLITRHDLVDVDAVPNLVRSIKAVWEYGAVPIVNENDAVSFDEISFGDNDQLAAELAALLQASYLVLLTDQDGIQADFGTLTQQRVEVVNVNEMGRYIIPTTSALGKGGFASKLVAATHALQAETEVYIGQVTPTHGIHDILTGKSGTRIVQ